LVSVNPFKKIEGLYHEDLMEEYARKLSHDDATKKSAPSVPHVFELASKAYKSLLYGGGSQAVVVTGESGAGKTELTKLIIKFLTFASKSDEIERKLNGLSPILGTTILADLENSQG